MKPGARSQKPEARSQNVVEDDTDFMHSTIIERLRERFWLLASDFWLL